MVVLSAMGDTTDELIALANTINPDAKKRELDNCDYIQVLIEQAKMNDTQIKIYEDYKKSSKLPIIERSYSDNE